MSKEQNKEEVKKDEVFIPMLEIFKVASEQLFQYLNENFPRENPVEVDQIFNAMKVGFSEAVQKVGYGIHTLSADEESVIKYFQQAAMKYPNGFDIVMRPKAVKSVILDPTTGKPADKKVAEKLIVSGR